MPPFILYAIYLLIAAIVLPLVAGVIGRVFFFRRDPDDIRNHRKNDDCN